MIRRIVAAVVFFFIFIREFIASNLSVAAIVLFTPRDRIDSRFVSYRCGDLGRKELFFIAHLITLTPGTLVTDIEERERSLVIHVLRRRKEGDSPVLIQEDVCDWIDTHLKTPLLRVTR